MMLLSSSNTVCVMVAFLRSNTSPAVGLAMVVGISPVSPARVLAHAIASSNVLGNSSLKSLAPFAASPASLITRQGFSACSSKRQLLAASARLSQRES